MHKTRRRMISMQYQEATGNFIKSNGIREQRDVPENTSRLLGRFEK